MYYVTVTGHSDGVHKKQRHAPRHVSGRLSSFCCLLTSQTYLQQTILIRTRPSRCRDSTIWQPCSGWTLATLRTLKPIVGLRHRQRFVHNLPVSATVPFAPTKFRIQDKIELCVTIGLLPYACIWQVEHALSPPPSPIMGSMPGTTSSYHDVIIWGPPLCISCAR